MGGARRGEGPALSAGAGHATRLRFVMAPEFRFRRVGQRPAVEADMRPICDKLAGTPQPGAPFPAIKAMRPAVGIGRAFSRGP